MEEEILKNRYEFSPNGKAIIDVTVGVNRRPIQQF
jgi:hypothetical protein